MTFGEAIEAAKKKHKIAREGWNGKGMYVYLDMFGGSMYRPCFVMRTAQRKEQPGWLASQADMLAEDWSVIR